MLLNFICSVVCQIYKGIILKERKNRKASESQPMFPEALVSFAERRIVKMKDILLENTDDKIELSDVQKFEKEINMVFPDDFKSFFLRTNGGYPSEMLFTRSFDEINPNTSEVYEQGTDVEQFLSLNEMKFEYGDIVDEGYIPAEYVPFARTSFGNLLLVRLDSTEYYGNICFANHDLFDTKNNQFAISKICSSFTEFINSLYVPEK